MIHELRIYNCVPGRMPDVLARLETAGRHFFRKHGIEPVGFWTVMVGESSQQIYYMLRWQSLADREAKWAALVSDEEWLVKRRETESNGPIVASVSNTLLSLTAFSRPV
ncbi:MAG TPA: NIPSNAP family protein [Ramlibacter sp.]|uniref:NIPSNAP family protein n=1 Tax=Ramlibacter sp. TaxID=1917967 RepID=UPI002CDBC003|nr:NIPSNAP family protein [Ramlibacter sp.]HVZ42197.1 NIPSNAP family protein [Ramlibacter sp.]